MTLKPPLKRISAAISGALMSGVAVASDYTQYFDTLYNESTGWGAVQAVTTTYEATVGASMFWVLMVTVPFICVWIKQQSVGIAAVVALISGGLLMTLVPAEFGLPIKLLLAIAIAGLLWHIFMKRD